MTLYRFYWLLSASQARKHVTNQFFKKFATILRWLAIFKSFILVAGDVNFHRERLPDAESQKCCQLDAFRLCQLGTEPTHDHGELLDVVLTSAEEGIDDVMVSQSGLSDPKVIHWTISTARPSTTYMKILCRRQKSVTFEEFITRLKALQLCQPVNPCRTITDLTECYFLEITEILDDLAPVTEMSVCTHPHQPFYDTDCRQS